MKLRRGSFYCKENWPLESRVVKAKEIKEINQKNNKILKLKGIEPISKR